MSVIILAFYRFHSLYVSPELTFLQFLSVFRSATNKLDIDDFGN